MSCLRCFALLSTIGCACGFEDVAALIQHKQSVGVVDTAYAFDENTQALPKSGPLGFRISRASLTAEAGSSIVVNYSSSCEESDEYGAKECLLLYGAAPEKTVEIHLASGGLQSTDTLRMSWDFRQTHNTSYWASSLVPANSTMVSNCGFCENSCTLELTNSKMSMTASYPTHLDTYEICDDSTSIPVEEITLAATTEHFPKPWPNLDLKANITAGLGVLRQDGGVRAQGSWMYKIGQEPVAASFADAISAEDDGAALAQRPMGIMGMLQEVLLPQMLLNPATELVQTLGIPELSNNAAISLRSVDNRRTVSHALELDVTVKSLKSGASFSLLSDDCNSTDGLGSVTCHWPFDGDAELSPAMDISFTAAEGSTLYASSKFTLGGSFGQLFAHKFKKKEMTVPLCGTAPVVVTDVNGFPYKYKPSKCGSYSLDLTSTAPFTKPLVEFDDIPLPRAAFMPFLPRSLNEVLPATLVMELEMTDAASSTIASFEMTASVVVV